MTAERTSIRGVVETVFYSGPAFSAGRLRTAAGAIVKFAGKVFVRENDAVRLEGHWVNHPKYGRQFEAEFMGHDLEMDPDGLANFLANHPDVKGIGPVKARLIADEFGRGFDAAIRASPEAVAAAAKVPVEIALDLQRIWIANSDFNTAMAYLSAFGLTHHQVTTLVGKFGSQVVPILERDPYVLMREISGFGFKRVDKIARKMGTPKDLPSRIRAGLHYSVLAALDDGDCWVEFEDLLDRANTLLVMDTLDSREVIEGHLEALIAEGRLVSQPFERLVVADPEIHRMETELAEVLKTAGRRSPHAVAEVDHLLDAEGGELNPEQRDAVGNALNFSISLMTGGAGSGKTYAVSTIASIAERLELKVVLAAPTGKAAKRLEEVVGHEASTIHRLLGFNGHTYSRDALNPIEADILVVDEVSMVDIALAWRLFQAVDRTRTAVVLVGDHNQLPPVGPGNLLRDLVRSHGDPDHGADADHPPGRCSEGELHRHPCRRGAAHVGFARRRAPALVRHRQVHGPRGCAAHAAAPLRGSASGAARLRPDSRCSGAHADAQRPARHGGVEYRVAAPLAAEVVRGRGGYRRGWPPRAALSG